MAETKESRTLAVFVLSPDTTKASVKAFVAGLPTIDLPKVIVRAREVGGLVKAIVNDGEAEMRSRAAANAEGAIAPGQRWVDPDTGVVISSRASSQVGRWWTPRACETPSRH